MWNFSGVYVARLKCQIKRKIKRNFIYRAADDKSHIKGLNLGGYSGHYCRYLFV